MNPIIKELVLFLSLLLSFISISLNMYCEEWKFFLPIDNASCRIMGMNYSTKGLKDTSHLNATRLIGFMRNYGHELLNSRTS